MKIINRNKATISHLSDVSDILFAKSKSMLSFSQLVTAQPIMNNFYVHQSIPMLPPDPSHVYRLLISPNLSLQDMELSINHLKSNRIMKELIDLNNKQKYGLQASRIIIDSQVYPTINEQTKQPSHQYIEKNILEIQKLIQDGLGLTISFLISNHSYSQGFLNIIKKKRKAISDGIIHKEKSFQQIVYENGYKLQHILLKGYVDGQPTNSLQQANSININEFIPVLNMINFRGKLVLPQTNFLANFEVLEKALKANGYEKKSIKDVGKQNWIQLL